jgi:hypothetical protein
MSSKTRSSESQKQAKFGVRQMLAAVFSPRLRPAKRDGRPAAQTPIVLVKIKQVASAAERDSSRSKR